MDGLQPLPEPSALRFGQSYPLKDDGTGRLPYFGQIDPLKEMAVSI